MTLTSIGMALQRRASEPQGYRYILRVGLPLVAAQNRFFSVRYQIMAKAKIPDVIRDMA